MMKVIKTNATDVTFFDDLSIGDVFFDPNRDLCIKTGHDTCIYLTAEDEWDIAFSSPSDIVTPIEADLVIK